MAEMGVFHPTATAINRVTGQEATYAREPKAALILAYQQYTCHRYDWWSKDYFAVTVQETDDAFMVGDWIVHKEGQ